MCVYLQKCVCVKEGRRDDHLVNTYYGPGISPSAVLYSAHGYSHGTDEAVGSPEVVS